MMRQGRIGLHRGNSWLLHFTRRWLACHAEIAALLDVKEPGDVAEARAILLGRSLGGFIINAYPASTNPPRRSR